MMLDLFSVYVLQYKEVDWALKVSLRSSNVNLSHLLEKGLFLSFIFAGYMIFLCY